MADGLQIDAEVGDLDMFHLDEGNEYLHRVLKSHPAVADCACIAESAGADKVLVVAYAIPHAGATVTTDSATSRAKAWVKPTSACLAAT